MTERKTTASQHGTHPAYHVEVRSTFGVRTMMGKAYGTDWTQFTPEQTCIPPSALHKLDRYFGLMTYAEATAVAWMVKAYCDSMQEMGAYGMEVRIVESQVTYAYDAVRKREFDPLPHRPQAPTEENHTTDHESR